MMLSLSEYAKHDGLGLAELVARKEVSAEELVATAVQAIEKVNPQLNAVLQVLSDQAQARFGEGCRKVPSAACRF